MKEKQTQEVGIIFDIGSASVGAGLVLFSPGKKPHIVYTTRKEMGISPKSSAERLFFSMRKAFSDVAHSVGKHGLSKLSEYGINSQAPDHIFTIFSSPWYISQTKNIYAQWNEPKTITAQYIQDRIQEEQEGLLESALGVYIEDRDEDFHLLEHNVVQVKLNGYDIPDPHNKKAQEFEMSLFISMIPQVVARIGIDLVSSIFHTESLHMHSFSLSAFSTLRNIFVHDEDFLFLDVAGEVTDVNLVKGGALVESASFPFGRNSMVRIIARTFNTTEEEALSRLRRAITNLDSGDISEEMMYTLEDIKKHWNRELESMIEHFNKTYPAPRKIFYMSDDFLAPFILWCIRSERYTPVFLSDEVLDRYVEYGSESLRDSFIATEALFFNTHHEDYQ